MLNLFVPPEDFKSLYTGIVETTDGTFVLSGVRMPLRKWKTAIEKLRWKTAEEQVYHESNAMVYKS